MENHPVSFRIASIADLDLLRYWDQQEHVIASNPNDDWGWETELLRQPIWREQFIAEWYGKAIGFLQIIDPKLEESHYWGNVDDHLRALDIWIGEQEYLGQGIGTVMMKWAINRCFSDKEITGILVDPIVGNFRVHRFYEKLGFISRGTRILGEELCIVYLLTRKTWATQKSEQQ